MDVIIYTTEFDDALFDFCPRTCRLGIFSYTSLRCLTTTAYLSLVVIERKSVTESNNQGRFVCQPTYLYECRLSLHERTRLDRVHYTLYLVITHTTSVYYIIHRVSLSIEKKSKTHRSFLCVYGPVHAGAAYICLSSPSSSFATVIIIQPVNLQIINRMS